MDNQSNRVTVAQAAEELGIHVATLRYMLETEQIPIGRCIRRKGSKRRTYLIFRDKLDKELGRTG